MIPRVFHRIWLGPAPFPPAHVPLGFTWRRFHTDWEHRLWTEVDLVDELEALPRALRNVYDAAGELAPGAVGQLRSDILRYWLLFRHGGVYIDTDMEALRSLEPLLPGIPAFLAWETTDRWIGNSIMGAVAGHGFLEQLLEHLPGNVAELASPGHVRPNRLTGPVFLTGQFNRAVARADVHVFPQRWFYPYRWDELERGREKFTNAYAVHHWQNMRNRKGIVR